LQTQSSFVLLIAFALCDSRKRRAIGHAVLTRNYRVAEEAALATNQAEIDRLVEAISRESRAAFFKRSVRNHATDWIASKLRFGANIGLPPEVSMPILFDILDDIRAIVSSPIEREKTEGSTDDD
jgi:hypothetical protein